MTNSVGTTIWSTTTAPSMPPSTTVPIERRLCAPAPVASEDPRPARGLGWDSMCAAAASAVHVQSAMVSSNPANSMAHVNGQVLRVGETLAINGSSVVFTIKEVTKDGIVLRAWSDELQREALFRVTVGGAGN